LKQEQGGVLLVYIHFEKETEALKLLEYISVHPLGTEMNEYIFFHPEKGLFLHLKDNYINNILPLLSDVFYSYLLEDKLPSWLESILRQKYYYRDQDEIDAIIEIACSIIDGQMQESAGHVFLKEKEIIQQGLYTFLTESISFSFDSFATFRLKSFYDSLFVYVENAIDEYKLEQDYQNFIATLRDLLYANEPKMDIVHLLHKNGFHFFDHEFRKLDKQEIQKLIDRKLLAENPVYIDSSTLAPLISIAPKKLHLYTDEAEDGLIQTVLKIFEERTVIRSVNVFYSCLR
jgi:putative sporulation protein YtxC